jgi:hypothetical protein
VVIVEARSSDLGHQLFQEEETHRKSLLSQVMIRFDPTQPPIFSSCGSYLASLRPSLLTIHSPKMEEGIYGGINPDFPFSIQRIHDRCLARIHIADPSGPTPCKDKSYIGVGCVYVFLRPAAPSLVSLLFLFVRFFYSYIYIYSPLLFSLYCLFTAHYAASIPSVPNFFLFLQGVASIFYSLFFGLLSTDSKKRIEKRTLRLLPCMPKVYQRFTTFSHMISMQVNVS